MLFYEILSSHNKGDKKIEHFHYDKQELKWSVPQLRVSNPDTGLLCLDIVAHCRVKVLGVFIQDLKN